LLDYHTSVPSLPYRLDWLRFSFANALLASLVATAEDATPELIANVEATSAGILQPTHPRYEVGGMSIRSSFC
jgi:hypothetical protein